MLKDSRSFFAGLVLAVLIGIAPDSPAQGPATEAYYDFRGRPIPPDLTFGDPGGQFIRSEPDGLRITLPKDKARQARVGLSLPMAIRGDFEVTTTFEILRAEAPPPEFGGYGVGILLRVNPDVGIGRYVQGGGRQVLVWDRWTAGDGGRKLQTEAVPSPAKISRIRLQRTGNTLHYLWSAEPTGDRFEEIHQSEYPDEVKVVRLIAETGKQACELDVRLRDLRVRGTDFVPLGIRSDGGGSKIWFWLAAAGVATLVIGIWLYRRQQRNTAVAGS
jgi:hypothetical protein